jgi:beta-mannosidase
MAVSVDLIGEGEMLLVMWDGDDGAAGQDIFAPRAYKTYDLLAPNLMHTITRDGADYIIDISSETLALFVAVEADVAGRFSDNAITILPQHPVQLRFTSTDPYSTPKFTLRDLHSATYA